MSMAFLDRDTSWMDFNERVLFCASNPSIPLLERVNFLRITSANLDEFFQVRMASLLDKSQHLSAKASKRSELVVSLLARAHDFAISQQNIFVNLQAELKQHNIKIDRIENLDTEHRTWLSEYFDEHIYPVLTPLAVDPAHPFPWISSLSINLAFILSEPKTQVQRFARLKIPTNLQRLIQLPDTTTFISLEEVIIHHWEKLFPGMDLESHFLFRVTRSSQYTIDEGDNLLEAMSTIVRGHKRFGQAVRLEIEKGIDNSWIELLQNEITIDSSRVFSVTDLIDFTDLKIISNLKIPSLRYPKWKPTLPARLNKIPAGKADLFGVLRDRDLLIHRPYESYDETVEALVHQAAIDQDVLAIKQTLYRAAGVDSPVVQSLCRAAENGKQVVALVELKARFDEQANIERAKKLERSGVHVVYGKVGLKTHAKLLHIVREEGDSIRYFSHISTGNYNPSTAGLYEDFDLFTSDQRIGRDVGDLFNNLTGYATISNFREILIAPEQMRDGLLEHIAGQSKPGGSIILKCNNIVDHQILSSLCEAESAGADIHIIVRASCGFLPETMNKHPNIKIKSIIGRFLEHSRIFKFGIGDEAKIYLGSADLMSRNLDNRVEVIAPVYADHVRRYINEALSDLLDNENEHWKFNGNGWVHFDRGTTVHQSLMEIAKLRSQQQNKLSDEQRNMPDTRIRNESEE